MNIDFTGLMAIAFTGLGAIAGLIAAVPFGGLTWAIWGSDPATTVALVCVGGGAIVGLIWGMISEIKA